jgi:hypothetical protein
MTLGDVHLMSRLDFDVRVLDIPPVPDREVAGLIRLKLRSVYPGNPCDTAFDFRLVRRGAIRRAIVFVSRTSTVDAYREAAGRRPLVLPYQMVLPRVPKRGIFRAWILQGNWAELLVFRDAVPVSSTVKRLGRSRRFDLETEEGSVPEHLRSGTVVVAAPAEQLDSLEKRDGTAYIPLETMNSARWKPDGLFRPEQKRAFPNQRTRLIALAAAMVVPGFLLFYKYVGSIEAQADRLTSLAASLEKSSQEAIDARREIDVLRAERARLESLSPRDLYLFLSELSLVVGERARIVSMSVKDDGFQVDAVGSNPFELMEGFKENKVFSDTKLSQVIPDGRSGRERFSITGAFHGR